MRLFVALDLPDPVKAALIALQADIPAARWSTRAQLHVTLFFIGETDRLAEVKDALEAVEAASFELTLAGIGRFPQDHRQPPRVLWAGVDVDSPLRALHEQITAALTGLGFKPEDRPFHPHITLARLGERTSSPAVDAFLSAHRDLNLSAPMSEFVLFSSLLRPEGARYTREAVYPLRP